MSNIIKIIALTVFLLGQLSPLVVNATEAKLTPPLTYITISPGDTIKKEIRYESKNIQKSGTSIYTETYIDDRLIQDYALAKVTVKEESTDYIILSVDIFAGYETPNKEYDIRVIVKSEPKRETEDNVNISSALVSRFIVSVVSNYDTYENDFRESIKSNTSIKAKWSPTLNDLLTVNWTVQISNINSYTFVGGTVLQLENGESIRTENIVIKPDKYIVNNTNKSKIIDWYYGRGEVKYRLFIINDLFKSKDSIDGTLSLLDIIDFTNPIVQSILIVLSILSISILYILKKILQKITESLNKSGFLAKIPKK